MQRAAILYALARGGQCVRDLCNPFIFIMVPTVMIVHQIFRTIPDSFLDLELEVRNPWEQVKRLECKDGVGWLWSPGMRC